MTRPAPAPRMRKPSDAMMRALRFLAWKPGDPDITAPRVDCFYACARRGLIVDMDRRWHITHAGRAALGLTVAPAADTARNGEAE